MSMSSPQKEQPRRFFCLGPTEHHDDDDDDNVDDASSFSTKRMNAVPLRKVKETKEEDMDILKLEDTILSYVVEEEEELFKDDNETTPKSKQIITDAQWLHCRRDPPATVYYHNDDDDDDDEVEEVVIGKTVLGILEQQQQQQELQSVSMSLYTTDGTSSQQQPQQQQDASSNVLIAAPHCDWKRQSLTYNHVTTQKQHIHLDWIDIRSWQQQQQQQQQQNHEFFLQTSSHICYFLRSLLGSSNEASPWCSASDSTTPVSDVVAILMSTNHNKEQDPNLDRFLNFHHGNACPSYYLHSTTKLQYNHVSATSPMWILQGSQSQPISASPQPQENAILVVFRRLPPRDHLSSSLPPPSVLTASSLKTSSLSSLTDGCLWEMYNPPKKGEEKEQPTTVPPQLRMTGPPYMNSSSEDFLTFLKPLLQPENLQLMQQEALKIPQWTAWPEKQHYSSSTEEEEESWTVFPLCHCFPSNHPENLKWISLTSQFVPHTTQLLQTHLGSSLRTALFSKLLPNTVLEPHTGWEDLANHVYRLHIPLEVPPSVHPDDGFLCGTWVDGCVETHSVGNIICFDDSKVHRAFNYSSTHSRVVLIVDIARPSHLPTGTATGGHTEELDKFIDQLN